MLNPCFYFNIHHDEPYAERLRLQIQSFYPESEIIAIADGPIQYPLSWAIPGEHLKQHGSIIKFIRRNLLTVLAGSTSETIVKIDPDSFILAPLPQVPPSTQFAGQVYRQPEGLPWVTSPGYYCAGFCWAMTRSLAMDLLQLIDSDHTLESKYTSRRNLYRRSKNPSALTPHEDFVIGHLIQSIGAKPQDWPNIKNSVAHPVGL
jgi:hypothetical protein